MPAAHPPTPSTRIFLLAGFVSLCASRGQAQVPLPDSPLDHARLVERYDLSFRGSRYDYQSLRVEGSGVQISLVKPTSDGLRVHVPPKTIGGSVGLCTKFGIRGDFELRVSYEFLGATKPTEGPGIGLAVFLQSAEQWDEHISLSRRVAPKTGQATFSAEISRGADSPTGGGAGSLPSTSKEGQFAIARSGSTVSLYAADEKGGFRKVSEADFGAGTLMFVRLSTLYDGADRGLDILWKDLTVRAESLPRNPGQPSGEASRPPWLVVGGFVFFVIAAIMMRTYWTRRSRKQR